MVSWRCDQCPDGHPHQWTARISKRTEGTGCPQCCGRKVCQHNSLATKAPWAAADWDFQANADLGTPEDIVASSHRRVHWRCLECKHSWIVSPGRRTHVKSGCPKCAVIFRAPHKQHPTFADCQHQLLTEWDHVRNKIQGNFPSNTKLRSAKQIWWLCSRCPAGQTHSWSVKACHRTSKLLSGCPFCAGRAACKCNSLQSLYPRIAAEWDYDRNALQPSDYPASSRHVAWWSTADRESWQQTINSRTNGVQQVAAREMRIWQREQPKEHT